MRNGKTRAINGLALASVMVIGLSAFAVERRRELSLPMGTTQGSDPTPGLPQALPATPVLPPEPAPRSEPAPSLSAPPPALAPAYQATRPDQPKLLTHPLAYPTQLRETGVAGQAWIKVRIGPLGTVTAASLEHTSGNAVLDRSAVSQVLRWTFEAGAPDRTAVLRVSFALTDF